ncbi:ABC-type transport auxiliary lipoprotein family protein [Rhizorhapis sp. SPR117]|uniref:ABC-type transport auxiliary lipoprotein family protein n=1 Tax=Rhizorhapis sp. SPR117 TaxID=2912611 RepID=UPI001F471F28|nr:ABC-type transport auxiliary lipoprotein family protein [Rhizorhapis sp. SPR117]
MRKLLLPLLLAAPLAACVSFGAKTPERLLTLTAQSRLEAGTARSTANGRSLVVAVPETPRMLDTNRIPVQVDDTSVAYVKDAQWVDQPGRLFQRLLSETIAAKTNRVLLDPRQYSGESNTQLTGELLRFGIDAQTNEAVVTYDATQMGADGATIMKKRFSASRPVGAIKAERVGGSLNDAANDVAAQVASWVSE